MKLLSFLNYLVSVLFIVCYAYQFFYIPIVWFFRKRKEKKVKESIREITNHSYAVLICARNESAVIRDLLNSLKQQTYPSEYVKVFLLADNCTDNTAEIGREEGAVVYERFNDKEIGKGYALNELLGHIKEDFPEGFDGYFVFDADNILSKDYIERMNEYCCAGYEIVTSYRNSKNYGSSWLSAGQALWFLRESRYLHDPRFILNISGTVSGTGFMFTRTILEENGGWPYHLLIEDIQFSIDQIIKGRKVAFCSDAVFYDEQPVTLRQSWRQRSRWTRGYLQVLFRYFGKLMKGIFHGDWSCFDVLMNIAPAYFLSTVAVGLNVTISVIALMSGDDIRIALASIGELLLSMYAIAFAVGFITTITEWKVIRASTFKKIFYMFTFPFFMMTFIPISIVALFQKNSWKPIVHTQSLDQMKKEGEDTDF
ncbi:MAG: glycosyltransferase family 2 protein [Lachnospiraceae bacterium]|nr:glycosyltransferase family 2 protein [Lachnospiraceae bacterium]